MTRAKNISKIITDADLSGNLNMGDGDIIKLGDGADLQIKHDASNSFIRDEGTGNLYFDSVVGNFYVRVNSSENAIEAVQNGAVTLYHNGLAKIATASDGVTLSGNLNMGDGDIIKLGASADLQIYHDGSNSIIKDNGTGALFIDGSNAINFRSGDGGEYYAVFNDDGAVSLRHNNVEKFATSSSGVTVTGNITNTSGDLTLDVAGDITLDADGAQIRLKDGGTQFGLFGNENSDFSIQSSIQDKDMLFQGNDGGVGVTALTLDMSDAGTAVFNNRIRAALASDGSPSYSFGNDTHTGMFSPGNDLIGFSTGGAERARINATGMLMLNGINEVARFVISQNTQALNMIFLQNTNSTAGGNFVSMVNSGGVTAGTINQNGSTTVAYNTSSDYRLKENVSYNFDATTRLKQLKPARFNWIEDETNTIVDGFIAHEVSSIVPEAITGEKDATKEITNIILNADSTIYRQGVSETDWEKGKLSTTDENGNTVDPIYASDTTWVASKTIIDAQGIDQAKLVPLLVKTIQELEARITALENA